VIGVDSQKFDGIGERLDGFVEADLNQGLPKEVGTGYDVVIATDLLEQLYDPAAMLGEMQRVLAPGGVVMVSVANVAHWYPRLRMMFGRFQYERRGIFDFGHIRFFTGRTFEKTATSAGLRIRRLAVTGMPVEVTERGGSAPRWFTRLLGRADKSGLALSPTLFGYQLVYELDLSSKGAPR